MRYFLMAAILTLIGCATGPKYSEITPTDSKSVFTVYRKNKFLGVGHIPVILVDGSNKFSLKAGGYKSIPLTSGQHKIEVLWADEKEYVFDLNVEPHKIYFLRYEVILGRDDWKKKYAENKNETLAQFSKENFDSDSTVVKPIDDKIPFDGRCYFVESTIANKELKDTSRLE